MGGFIVKLYVLLLAALVPGCAQEPPPAAADVPELAKRVLVVINRASPDSIAVGDYYVRQRRIPRTNVVRVDVSTSENLSADEYKYGIEEPVRNAIRKSGNEIDFIVLTMGLPIRLRDNEGYSVDGHLAAMNLDLKAIEELKDSAVRQSLNPYFNKFERFSSRQYNMYLVTRLIGYTKEHAMALVDRSLAAKPESGLFFFDAAENRKEGAYLEMQQSLYRANALLDSKGFQARLDETPEFVAPSEPLMGYASWGSNDAKFDPATYRKIRFKPGALCETFVSTSGRTFQRTEGGQSLIADLIESGVTGVKGYVSEPFTFALAKPDILFDRYTSGFTLAESFYAASMVLKWKDIVIGDPICAPYAKP